MSLAMEESGVAGPFVVNGEARGQPIREVSENYAENLGTMKKDLSAAVQLSAPVPRHRKPKRFLIFCLYLLTSTQIHVYSLIYLLWRHISGLT